MYERILVPVDGSATSRRGLEEAVRLAGLTGGKLKLMYVIDELALYLAAESYASVSSDYLTMLKTDGNRVLCQEKAFAEKAGVQVETMLFDNFSGAVHELVINEAATWPADVIVLGTHGRRGVGRILMGSTAEKVLRHAACPVLLVRAPTAPAATTGRDTSESVTVKIPTAALSIE
jgi:nucleotide-binding universal stress UspA family protein